MSSTLRGYERHKTDYYITPKAVVRQFLKTFIEDEEINSLNGLAWLDPCCGGDVENEASYLSVIREDFKPKNSCGVDIREDSKADIVADFLKIEGEDIGTHDVIISNPPFKLAKEFIEHSMDLIEENGYVIMLLRLNFLGSISRRPFFKKYMPYKIYVHTKRISFTNGSTDSIEYAHFVWRKGLNPVYSKLILINS